ncbi:UNVERIFIED_CONTAM: hypothetical protein GTU68_029227 [Idotea baltica]|nr:hypothetical protein [Idotea baltica]
MGGDLGSKVVVQGAVEAHKKYSIPVVLVGDESEIKKHLSDLSYEDKIDIIHAPQVITMKDSPARAMRTKPEASIIKAFKAVKEGKASGVVSPGNTGAVMASGLFISSTLPGIDRPAIASLIPRGNSSTPTVLLDSGANTDCHSEQLVQFAVMGDFYSRLAIGLENPSVGLLSNGTEKSKGTDLIRATSSKLSKLNNFNYIGFVEGRDIVNGNVDIVVCDGFLGNVVLKTIEGGVRLVLGMFFAKPTLKKVFHKKLNPSEYGGAPLLGLNDVAIICHGSSNSMAIKNAIKVANKLYNEDLIKKLNSALLILDNGTSESEDNNLEK